MAGYGGESGTTAVHGRSRGRNAIGTRRPNEAQKIDIDQIVDNSLVEVFTSSTTKAKGALPVAQSLSLRNTGNAALGAVIKISNWTDATTQSGDVKLNFIILNIKINLEVAIKLGSLQKHQTTQQKVLSSKFV